MGNEQTTPRTPEDPCTDITGEALDKYGNILPYAQDFTTPLCKVYKTNPVINTNPANPTKTPPKHKTCRTCQRIIDCYEPECPNTNCYRCCKAVTKCQTCNILIPHTTCHNLTLLQCRACQKHIGKCACCRKPNTKRDKNNLCHYCQYLIKHKNNITTYLNTHLLL